MKSVGQRNVQEFSKLSKKYALNILVLVDKFVRLIDVPCFVREAELLLEGRIQLLLENKDIGIQTWQVVNKSACIIK